MICSGNERKIRCRQSFQAPISTHRKEKSWQRRETWVKNDKSDKEGIN